MNMEPDHRSIDLLDSFNETNSPIKPPKTYYILLVFWGISILGSIISITTSNNFYDSNLILKLFSIIFSFILFYLLLKRNKLGWMLSIILCIISIISQGIGLFALGKYITQYKSFMLVSIFIGPIITVAMLVIMLHKPLLNYIGIDNGYMKRGILNGLICGALVGAYMVFKIMHIF